MPVTHSFKITTTMSGASADYAKYLFQEGQALTKTDKLQSLQLLDFAVVPWDSSFVKLTRGAYITVDSLTYPTWYTGYVTNDPRLVPLGKKTVSGVVTPVFGYVYQCSSDPYILSINPLGIVSPFFNIPMGVVLKTLANMIAPGVFDVTGIADGPLVAEYVVDPSKKFGDVFKEFCDNASYVFYGKNKKLFFVKQDDTTLTPVVIDATDKDFTPSALTVSASTSPLINDATVLGQVEPQNYVTEYLVGTGLDAAFPLVSGVFGADSSVLIDETFPSATIDSTKWVVYDNVSPLLQISNGYLNSLGGNGTGTYDVRLQSLSPIPMDGRMRLTHGEWDFLSGVGVIGGCWKAQPSSGLTGCLYGLKYDGTTLKPITNGSVDSTQSTSINTSKRYVIRTLVEFTRSHRYQQGFGYVDVAGVVQRHEGSTTPDTATWQTLITEVDPANGLVTKQSSFRNSTALTGTGDSYALYIPLASDSLHATVTSITVSTPLAATLEMASNLTLLNWDFESWSDLVTPTSWTGTSNIRQAVFDGDAGSAMKMSAGLPGAKASQSILVPPNRALNVSLKLQRKLAAAGTVNVKLTGTGLTETGFSVSASSMSSSVLGTFYGQLSPGISSIPTDLALKITYSGGGAGDYVYVDDVIPSTDWQAQIIGPNELDALDGTSPIATIVQANTGGNTNSSMLGTPQYNPGQAQLVFFKDSLTLTSNIPPLNELIRLSYRGAGAAIGRVVDGTSVSDEATKWGDLGYRSVVRSDLSPRPRNSSECELAAAAIVSENSYKHYQGTYTQWADYLAGEPVAGSLLKITNTADIPNPQFEEVTSVVTTLQALRPERFQHVITFGQPDHIGRVLSKVADPVGGFQKVADAASPPIIDLTDLGVAFAADVTRPVLVSWDENNLQIDAGQDLGGGGASFEVRYTDQGWGASDGRNLLMRSGSRLFSIPRTLRGRAFFIRQANTNGTRSRYSCAMHVGFPAAPVVSEPATLYITADTTIVAGDWIIKVDTTAGDVVVTLPLFSSMTNFTITVVLDTGTHAVMVEPATGSSDTIVGQTTYTLSTINQTVTISG